MFTGIGITLVAVLGLAGSSPDSEAASQTMTAQVGEDAELLQIEEQIETVLSQDSERVRSQETHRMLEMITHQFPILGLPQSMVERNRAQRMYEILSTSRRVTKPVTFEIFCGVSHGFPVFRVGNTIFVSRELFSLPDTTLQGIMAHELSHDERDYKRKLLIDMNDLEPGLKEALKARIEARADEGAVHILSDAGLDTRAVQSYLEIFRKAGKLNSIEADLRLAATRRAMIMAGSFGDPRSYK